MSRYTIYNKAQNALEFLVIIGILVVFLILVLIFISQQTTTVQDQQKFMSAEFVVNQLQEEINLAKNMRDGYSRTFMIPDNYNGIPIEAELREGRELLIQSEGGTILRFLPVFVAGNISTGQVEIMKKGNMVGLCINSCNGVFPWDFSEEFTCQRTDGVWVACDPKYYVAVPKIRVDCGEAATYAELEIANYPRSIYIDSLGVKTSDNLFEFDGFTLNASGSWQVKATCASDLDTWIVSTDWELPYGQLVARPISLDGCVNNECRANRNMTFVYEVECIGGECGQVWVYLDP